MAEGVIIFAIMMAGLAIAQRMRDSDPTRAAMRAYVRGANGYPMRQANGAFRTRDIPERRYLVRVRDIEVQLWAVVRADSQQTEINLWAEVAVPPSAALELDSAGKTAPPAALETAWRAVVGAGRVAVSCDGRAVGATARHPFDVPRFAALADLVAIIARLDGGLGDRLLALPGAIALTGHALVPGVVLDADGLVIGVRKRSQVVAQLDDVTHVGQLPPTTQELAARAGDGELLVTEHGARFTWKGIERDPAKLRAGVDALRSLRGATGPYR